MKLFKRQYAWLWLPIVMTALTAGLTIYDNCTRGINSIMEFEPLSRAASIRDVLNAPASVGAYVSTEAFYQWMDAHDHYVDLYEQYWNTQAIFSVLAFWMWTVIGHEISRMDRRCRSSLFRSFWAQWLVDVVVVVYGAILWRIAYFIVQFALWHRSLSDVRVSWLWIIAPLYLWSLTLMVFYGRDLVYAAIEAVRRRAA